jgi:beta-galactosidase
MDHASPGVYLTTKSLTDKQAEVEVRAIVSNGTKAEAKVSVEFQINDAQGAVVASEQKNVAVPAGAAAPVVTTLHIQNLHCWNGRLDPCLYGVTVKVRNKAKTIYSVRQELGLRIVAITEQDGFLLNGKPYPIHGVNRHQERQDKGWALSPADHEEDARLILEMGANAVRNAHYPQSGYWHELADRSGLLMWDEVSLVDAITLSPEFDANAELQLRELIAQLYNHPSIAFWGLFNEIAPQVQRLKAVIQQLDSSRLIVAASYGKDHLSFDRIADHTGFNRYPLWYGGGQECLTHDSESYRLGLWFSGTAHGVDRIWRGR